jgi:anti-sigma regulatory factor (Ser/Thr protein kinase)
VSRITGKLHPYTTPTNETLTLITAELTANAVRHGHVPGRGFHLRLTASGTAFRIEVTDTRDEKQPTIPHPTADVDTDAESGRGLRLVEALADKWGVTPRPTAPGKTVWAEFRMPTDARSTRVHDLFQPVPHGDEGSSQ